MNLNKSSTIIDILDYIDNLLILNELDYKEKEDFAISGANTDYGMALRVSNARSVVMSIRIQIMTDTEKCK